MKNKTLSEVIAELLRDDRNISISNSIFGTDNVKRLTEILNGFCEKYLNESIKSCIHGSFSVGASFGIQLINDERIFIKVNHDNEKDSITPFSLESLQGVAEVQNSLFNKGFPCPKVILPPLKYEGVIITVNEYLDIGIQRDAHDPTIRRVIAKKLAELIHNTNQIKENKNIKCIDFHKNDSLYPIPHNCLFNFDMKNNDTIWIDEIATRSKQVINEGEKNIVLGHCDWSLKHFRFENDRIVVIYDWDSLYYMDEYHMLGIAASTFTTTWDITVEITPSQEEAYKFIKEYEKYKRKSFTKEELKKISACATYMMAYIARCELSVDPENKNYKGSFREALYNMQGDFYLSIN